MTKSAKSHVSIKMLENNDFTKWQLLEIEPLKPVE